MRLHGSCGTETLRLEILNLESLVGFQRIYKIPKFVCKFVGGGVRAHTCTYACLSGKKA